eukprot:GFYU01002970.1.p1 GENE.GFYU01002970.1~~GFYU01002970.1.p1  ORF type:complete len:1822 (+),score=570.21 GFYU01002970.1:178-5643(+)
MAPKKPSIEDYWSDGDTTVLLPYRDQISDACTTELDEIRKGLAWSIAVGDIEQGCRFYTRKALMSVLDMKVPIDPTIGLEIAQLMYRLIIQKGVPLHLQGLWCELLGRLLDEIKYDPDLTYPTFDWRPLYELLEAHHFRSGADSSFLGPTLKKYHHTKLMSLVQKCRPYFSPDSSAQLLETLRPMFCLQDSTSLFKAQGFLCSFLPSRLKNTNIVFEDDWLDEFVELWRSVTNVSYWDAMWLSLFARLAKDSSFHKAQRIDFSRHLPHLYATFFRILEVPSPQVKLLAPMLTIPRDDVYSFARMDKLHTMAKLIVYSLSNEGPSLDLFAQLFRSLEGYFHPSTVGGPGAMSLSQLLQSVGANLARRVGQERNGKLHEAHNLTPETVSRVVEILLHPSLLAIFNKSSLLQKSAQQAIKHLASVCPELVVPAVMERVTPALETSDYAHQTVAVIDTVYGIVHPLIWRKTYPEGAAHLPLLLQLTLPGLDLNDPRKTSATLKLYSHIFSYVPLIDSTSLTPMAKSDVDSEAHSATATFEDFLIQFMDRMLSLCENQESRVDANGKKQKSDSPNARYTVFIVFQQLSDSLLKVCLQKTLQFVSSVIFTNSIKEVGHIVASLAERDGKAAADVFLPYALDKLLEDESKSDAEIMCAFRVLEQTLAHANKHVLPYKTRVMAVFDKYLMNPDPTQVSKRVHKMACKAIKSILRDLTYVYPTEARSHSLAVWNSKEFQESHASMWGDVDKDIAPDWHIPTEAEIEMALEITQRYLVEPLEKRMATPDTVLNKEQTVNLLQIVRAVLRGSLFILHSSSHEDGRRLEREFDNDIECNAGLFKDMKRPLFPSCVDLPCKDKIKTYRDKVYDLCTKACVNIRHMVFAHREDDTTSLKTLCKVLHLLLVYRGYSHVKTVRLKKHLLLHTKWISNKCEGKHFLPRAVIISVMHMQHQLMVNETLYVPPPCIDYMTLSGELTELSMHQYSQVRKSAQKMMELVYTVYPNAFITVLPDLVQQLKGEAMELEDTPKCHGRTTGAIHQLQTQFGLGRVLRKWQHCGTFFTALCAGYKHERLSTQARLLRLFASVAHTASPNPVSPPEANDGDVAFCRGMVPELTDDVMASAGTAIAERYAYGKSQFLDLESKLLGTLQNDTNLHWRFQLIVGTCAMLSVGDYSGIPPQMFNVTIDLLLSENLFVRQLSVRAFNLLCRVGFPKVHNKAVNGAAFDPAQLPDEANWETFSFRDKKWYDYNGLPPSFPKPTGPTPPEQQVEEWRTIVTSRFKDEEFLAKVLERFCNDHRGSGEQTESLGGLEDEWLYKFIGGTRKFEKSNSTSFDEFRAKFFKKLGHVMGFEGWLMLQPHFERLAKESEREQQNVAAEIFAGFVRCTKRWNAKDTQSFWACVIPAFSAAIDEATPEIVEDWAGALYYSVNDFDPRRISQLLDLLLSKCELKNLTSATQGKYFQLLAILMGCGGWRLSGYHERITKIALDSIVVASAQVRNLVGSVIGALFAVFWQPQVLQRYGVKPLNVDPTPLVDSFIQKLTELEQVTKDEVAKGKVDQSEADVQLRNCRETLMSWITRLCGTGMSPCVASVVPKVLPYIFRVCSDIDQSVVVQARCVIAFAEQSIIPAHLFEEWLTCAADMQASTSWNVRLYSLQFLKFISLRNWCTLTDAQRERVIQFIIVGFNDERIEVQEAYAGAFSGVLRYVTSDVVATYAEQFSKSALSRRRRKLTKEGTNSGIPADTIKDVIGLVALVRAFPYDIPPWMPSVLDSLGRQLEACSSNTGLTNLIKKTFAEFKKFHQDEWHIHKQKFTEDQLEVLTDLLLTPSYYA